MKRGTSGLSLVVGVNKPAGMTSHDVVGRCRAIFGERRVGHTGTLDPLATGALLLCVGPATRLDAYLAGHDKRYRVRIAFGAATTTDDAQGEVTVRADVPGQVLDPAFAARFVKSLEGPSKQLPPVYSALKVDGRKACDEARAGRVIDLAPRDIEVYSAELLAVNEAEGDGLSSWDVAFHVSKGTYIRALARDAGNMLGCPAHVAALERTRAGALDLAECVTLERLAEMGPAAALDPVRLLGFRFAYADGALAAAVANGAPLPAGDCTLYEQRRPGPAAQMCACTSGVCESAEPPAQGELVSMITENRLAAIYGFDAERGRFAARCVFQTGVSRGGGF